MSSSPPNIYYNILSTYRESWGSMYGTSQYLAVQLIGINQSYMVECFIRSRPKYIQYSL